MVSCRRSLLITISGMLLAAGPAFAQGATLEPAGANPSRYAAPTRQAVEIYNSGVSFLQQSKYAEAAERFQQAITVSPDFVNAHFNLGTATLLQGDSAGAMPELKKAVEMNPGLAPAWATLGSCYQNSGQTAEAIEAYKKYLQLSPHGDLAVKVQGLVASLGQELKRSESIKETDTNDYFHEATYGGLTRWAKMPVSVYIKPSDDVPGYRPEFLDLVKGALADWEKASQGRVSFVFTKSPENADIKVVFTHSLKDAVTAAEGGHTVVIPNKNGEIQSANVSLLTIPPSGTELASNYARRVDLHELGHALGILGHSTNPEDVMYASVLPTNKPVFLSARDGNTLAVLYSDEATKMAKPGLDPSLSMSGDPNSTINRVLTLNNEAKALIDKNQYAAGMAKLQQAHNLMPDNEVISGNLGSMYAKEAFMALQLRQFDLAETSFKKAIPLLEHGPNRMNLEPTLKNYSLLLKIQNRNREAAAIDAKLTAIGAH